MDALNPIAAVLYIEDGGYAQQVSLAPADLTSGIIFYTPQSSNLTFRLRIDHGGEQFEEHVRVLGAPRIAQTPLDRVPQSVPNKAPVHARVTPVNERAKKAPSADPKENSPTLGTANSKEPAIASTTGRDVESDPTAVSSSTVAAIAIPVPPAVETRANLAPTPALAEKPAPDVTPARAPMDQQMVSVPAAGGVSPPEAARTAVARDANELTKGTPNLPSAAAMPNARANYVAPKPIRQVRPQAPGNMPSGVSEVQVLVQIDSHGKVVKVTPVGWTVTNAPLMILAERAAMSWLFDPARLNGHPVSSQMNLTFRFRF
jgi:hypothetical protein